MGEMEVQVKWSVSWMTRILNFNHTQLMAELLREPTKRTGPLYRVNCDDTLRAIRDWI